MWPFSNKDKQAESGGDDQAGGSGLRYDQVREAENKRYLNELINIRRSPDVQKRLLEVLKYEPSLTKRIDIVERLDRLGVETLNWYEQRISLVKAGANKSQNEKNRKTAYFFQSPEYRSLSLESKVLLRGLEPPSLISFITKEYRRISAFGKREHLLKSSVFRMRHAPDAMLLHWCNGEMPIVCSTLEHTLSRVVERGWATLDIRSYNILVCLESLVQGWISEAPRMTAQTPSRLLWLKIGPLARTWFSLTKADDQISQALDGLAQFLKANGADGPQIRRHLAAAEAILDDNRAGVGFARAVLAIWMLLARRFTTREALCDALKPEAIQTTTWACPPDVLEKINAFIQARRDERDEFVRAILLLDELGIDTPEVMDERCMSDAWCLFSEALHVKPESGRTAASRCRQAISLDLGSFAERSISNLSYIITILLRDKVLAESTLSPERDSFDRALAAIRGVRQARDRLVLPLAMYDAWVRKTASAGDLSDTETGLARALAEAGATAAHAGLKLQQLVAQATGLDSLAGAGARAASGILIDLSHELREPQVFSGLRLQDALGRLQAWSTALAWLLGDLTIRGLVGKRAETEVDLATVEATLARMDSQSQPRVPD